MAALVAVVVARSERLLLLLTAAVARVNLDGRVLGGRSPLLLLLLLSGRLLGGGCGRGGSAGAGRLTHEAGGRLWRSHQRRRQRATCGRGGAARRWSGGGAGARGRGAARGEHRADGGLDYGRVLDEARGQLVRLLLGWVVWERKGD